MQLSSYNPFTTVSLGLDLVRQLNQDVQYRRSNDPGLVGPGPAHKVIRDDCILAGGFAALLMQTLHPLAMAGVAEHSTYRQDPLKRLIRTGKFVRATVLGPTDVAEAKIARVCKRHKRVKGTAPDGRSYSATDPELLTWIHVCEVYGFIRAFQRFHPDPPHGSEVDRYYEQMAVVAEKLGAEHVPKSREAVNAYFTRIRPQLASTEQSIDAMQFIMAPTLGNVPLERFFYRVSRGGAALLPDWSRQLHGMHRSPAEDVATVQLQAFFRTARLSAVQSTVALLAA